MLSGVDAMRPCANDPLAQDASSDARVIRCSTCAFNSCVTRSYPPAPAPTAQPPRALDTQVAGNHYKDMAIQPAEFIHKNKIEFLPGCVIKRMCRWRNKDGVQDLHKAIHEIELMIELEGTK